MPGETFLDSDICNLNTKSTRLLRKVLRCCQLTLINLQLTFMAFLHCLVQDVMFLPESGFRKVATVTRICMNKNVAIFYILSFTIFKR